MILTSSYVEYRIDIDKESTMRNITISRTKSFVGCMASTKIYVEDPAFGDTTINNTSCRKLGVLKNGEEKTFQIPEEACKIFVIQDKLSKGFCNEFYQLEAGNAPVFLKGQNRYNPAAGNCFRFDNNHNADATANRKKNNKIGLWVLIASAIIGFIIGYLLTSGILKGDPDPKTFSMDGFRITLTEEFKQTEQEGFTVCYESENMAVIILEETFADYPSFRDYTVQDYAETAIDIYDLNSDPVTDNGLCYYEYSAVSEGKTFCYLAFVYKSGDSFWLVQFATLESELAELRSTIMDYARSVEVTSELAI